MLIFLILSIISYIRKRMPLLILMSCITVQSQSQSAGAINELPFAVNIEPGFSFSRVIDHAFSSLPFKGFNPVASLSFDYYRPRFTHHIDLGYTAGKLSIDDHPEISLIQKLVVATYSAWYDLSNHDKPLQFQAGASVMTLYNHHNSYQFSNHKITYQWMGSVAVSPRLSYFFGSGERRWSIVEQPDISIISASRVSDFGGDEAGSPTEWKFDPVFSIHRVRNTFTIGRDISETSRLSLAYVWDFSKFTDYIDVYSMHHQGKLNYSFRF